MSSRLQVVAVSGKYQVNFTLAKNVYNITANKTSFYIRVPFFFTANIAFLGNWNHEPKYDRLKS